MKVKLIRKEVEKKIKEFFKDIQNKQPGEVRKIKRLAMHHNIKLGDLRKRFCKKCYSPQLRVKKIKSGMKRVECESCGYIARWRVK